MGWKDDAFWDGDPEQRLYNLDRESRVLKTCKYCNIHKLHWVKMECGWRLYDSMDNMHNCTIKRIPLLKSE